MARWIKWIVIGLLVGALLLGGVYAYCRFGHLLRPSAVIAELRAESELAARQHREQLDYYTSLLGEARNRADQLTDDLGRAEAENRQLVERARHLEDATRSLRDLVDQIQAASGRAEGYNKRIRDAAESAIRELRAYRGTLASSP